LICIKKPFTKAKDVFPNRVYNRDFIWTDLSPEKRCRGEIEKFLLLLRERERERERIMTHTGKWL